MTTHVFRKYAGYNPNEIKCWTPSTVIDESSFDIEDTVFTRGAAKAGTSIPSPLARMELFDTAFRIVADDRKDNLKGKTIYHQLVSDVLDVIQMLFNTNNDEIGIGKKIWFKEWRVRENIDKLKAKGESHPNNLLAKSLEQIFFDDKFTSTESIFLIYYEQKLLGGTSPLTLFFTSPNWARYIADGAIANVPKSLDGDVFFDNDYRALHERDKEFVKYLYKLLLQYPASFNKAEGLRSYINKTITTHFPSWRNEQEFQNSVGDDKIITNLLDANFDKVLTNVDRKLLTVNGIYFYHQKQEDIKERIKNNSDFIIRATVDKYAAEELGGNSYEIYPPLVLVDNMNVQGDYMDRNSPWSSDNKVKEFYHKSIPLFERKLPLGSSLAVNYPFITVDDFIEEVLIELPYAVNSAKFFTGFQGELKYLLPIKKEYFNFFSIDDLKNQLSINVGEEQVKVSLKIPIKNKKGVEHILFIKEYKRQNNDIVVLKADIGIFPFYQINDTDPNLQGLNDYTVLLAERDENPKIQLLDFYKYNLPTASAVIQTKVLQRSTPADVESNDAPTTSKYYKIREAFDYIELSYVGNYESSYKGLIIPNFANRTFSKNNLTKAYTFAIDFGTSNTHIAYMENDGTLPMPFEVDDSDQQMVLLNSPGTDTDLGVKYAFYGLFPAIDLTLRREFVPAVFSAQSKQAVSFPFKTASCEVTAFSNTDKSEVDLFSHINIGYYIDADAVKTNNVVYTTNLKWLLENNIDDSNKSRVKLFLKQLLLQIRAKAIINNARLDNLKVVWSVPLSMERGNRATLNNILKTAFDEVFGKSGAVLAPPIPESISPYFFLTKSDADIQSTANVVNIDIGGGTTDVMMFMESSGNRDDKYLTTSFKFAGSDLWGGGYKGKLKDNGFIKNYLNYQKANNIAPDEVRFFKRVKDDGNLSSDDLISLLFKYDDKFKFSDSITIGNPSLSIILYLHYAAIVYHIVQVLELKKYPLPRYLSFTGKGSQYIKLICGSDEHELEEFTKLLFKAYTKQPLHGSFEIHLNSNPKQITANGSVLYSLAGDDETAKFKNIVEFVHPGFNPETDIELTQQLVDNGNNILCVADTVEVDSTLNMSVLNNLNAFLEKTLTTKEIVDFLADFKIKNSQEVFAALKWNGDAFNGEGFVYDSFKKVLNDLKKLDRTSLLPESLFFFALKDSLYRLSKEIVKK